MTGKFEVYKDKKGEFRFRLKASNGQTILASEGYKTKASCMNGVKSVKTNAAKPARYTVKTQKNGKPMFTLTATNGEVIGTSQAYAAPASCKKGMASVMKTAPGASVDDQS